MSYFTIVVAVVAVFLAANLMCVGFYIFGKKECLLCKKCNCGCPCCKENCCACDGSCCENCTC